MVGHARTARPSGQSRLFSGQAGDVPVLGAAGVKSRSRFGSQKVRGRIHQQAGPTVQLGPLKGPQLKERQDVGPRCQEVMKAVAPTLLTYTHRVLP